MQQLVEVFAKQVLNDLLYVTGTDEVKKAPITIVQAVALLKKKKHIYDWEHPPWCLPIQLLPMHMLGFDSSVHKNYKLSQ